MFWLNLHLGSLVSKRTEYTTASDVVESAIPAINAACMFQPATKYVNINTNRNGARNRNIRSKKLSLYLFYYMCIYLSRMNEGTLAKVANTGSSNLHGCRIPRFPKIAPKINSIIATAIPNLSDIKLDNNITIISIKILAYLYIYHHGISKNYFF